jgi:hypothetical protein
MFACSTTYRDKKVAGVFVRFRAPLKATDFYLQLG